jgi:hypothetical protein
MHEKTLGHVHNKHFAQQYLADFWDSARLDRVHFLPALDKHCTKSKMRIMAELDYQNPARPSPVWTPGSGSFSFCTIPGMSVLSTICVCIYTCRV